MFYFFSFLFLLGGGGGGRYQILHFIFFLQAQEHRPPLEMVRSVMRHSLPKASVFPLPPCLEGDMLGILDQSGKFEVVMPLWDTPHPSKPKLRNIKEGESKR